jgi:WD40-like Beta Propeller Repeat
MVVLKNKALRTIMLAMALAAGLLAAGLMALVEPAQATFPGDNGRIAFASNRAPATAAQIYSVSSTGNEVDLNPVTTTLSGLDHDPVYSPDGTKIAFARLTGGNWNIWTISSTGGTNTNQITSNAANDLNPTWQSLTTAGNTPPTITDVRPAPNARIQNRSPLISATVRDAEDNLSATDIRLFVDGNSIAAATFSYDSTTDKLSYKSNQLSRGGHTIRIVATDTKGLSTLKTWSFRVRRNAG